ncbi:receptor-like protein 39 [Quercus lobata]|uniref:receptor-like protein 39 n=1 Tax=Quercus lobata TaxID=97700 RepID=UPI001244D24D|nr:receptor-like protein 39 [Quercus lobata]
MAAISAKGGAVRDSEEVEVLACRKALCYRCRVYGGDFGRSFSVNCVRRSANGVAHALARFARLSDNETVWLEKNPPPAVDALDAFPPLDKDAEYPEYRYNIHMCDNSYPKTASWKEDTDCWSIPSSLSNFTQITYLALASNSFSGLLPLSLFNLPNLSTLYLHNNQLVGPLPNHISGLLNLKDLYLSSNFLNGTLPSWLFSLPSLVKLYINGNQFIGEIGEFKSNSLEYLDLGYNKLQGSIPRSISTFVNLTYLSLSSNNWSIMLELEMISKLKNLYYLDFSNNLVSINNNVTYTLPNLYTLNLSSCNISEFPIFLRTPTNIEFLDLSKNRIYGQVPRWLGHVGSDSLYFLDLRNNLFQGPFPTLNFLSIQYLFVSNNKFTGEIPSSICNASALDIQDLSHNNLSGMIPKCLVHSNVLSMLDLQMNILHGTIPATFSTRNRFRNINLNGNQLEGPLPQSLANCRNLELGSSRSWK